jgi:hypothetical protein
MAVTISTIKTDGSGDFTTLALWEDWADDDPLVKGTSDYWAECYDIGDMGAFSMVGWTTSPPTATDYPRIYTPLAERHTGQVDGVQHGAWLTGSCIILDVDYVRVEGLYFDGVTASPIVGLSFNSTMNACLIDSNLIVTVSGAVGSGIGAILNSIGADSTGTFTIQNNIIWSRSTGGGMYGIHCEAESVIGNNPTLQVNMYNNTVVGGFGTTGTRNGIEFEETDGAGTATVNAEVVNNISCNWRTQDYNEINHDSGTITGSYNLSTDDSGDDWGATGAKTGIGCGNLFVNGQQNWDLQPGAPTIDAGSTLSVFDWDAVHISGDSWRPQGTAWDMGAMETTNSKERTRGTNLGFPFVS